MSGGVVSKRVACWAAAGVLAIAAVAVVVLPLSPSLSKAEALLKGPPPFQPLGESGVLTSARCWHTGLWGLFGGNDKCTLTFSTGDSYRCEAFNAGSVGPGVKCAPRPFRRGE